jgi:uncharacterized protein (DUF885 family)
MRSTCGVSALLSLALLCGSCSHPVNSSADSVKSISDAYWEFALRTNPELATQLGEYRYNDQLSEYSVAHYEAVNKEASALVNRLKAIDQSKLSESDRLDREILLGTR